ncbi:MAG: FAD-dependent oxidoreductase [Inquilinus sp.]|nr:FAD-dependent oxidoreductase [Inquilinus sp.]
MTGVAADRGATYPDSASVVIVGAGACGLTAAIAAREAGVDRVLVLERERAPFGNTSLSVGLVPVAGSRQQRAGGIEDDPDRLIDDIMALSKGRADPAMTRLLAEQAAPTLNWLTDRHGIGFELVEYVHFPGHSVRRMHAAPGRAGAGLIGGLVRAATRIGVEIVTDRRVDTLFNLPDGCISGVSVVAPDGGRHRTGCSALVLACDGFGANRALIRRYIPNMADAAFIGHEGSQGDALLWGFELGAATRHLSGHQAHGSVALGSRLLVTWAVMLEGGFQVNLAGDRFGDECVGFSEQAGRVLEQRDGVAWCVFDERVAVTARQSDDFREVEAADEVVEGETLAALAAQIGVPADALERTLSTVADSAEGRAADPFGRAFDPSLLLKPPYRAVKVTGALMHTQGGLVVDREARVLLADGTPLPNLFAGGGATAGVAGPEAGGYLPGMGLLTALVLGRVAGTAVAEQVLS